MHIGKQEDVYNQQSLDRFRGILPGLSASGCCQSCLMSIVGYLLHSVSLQRVCSDYNTHMLVTQASKHDLGQWSL